MSYLPITNRSAERNERRRWTIMCNIPPSRLRSRASQAEDVARFWYSDWPQRVHPEAGACPKASRLQRGLEYATHVPFLGVGGGLLFRRSVGSLLCSLVGSALHKSFHLILIRIKRSLWSFDGEQRLIGGNLFVLLRSFVIFHAGPNSIQHPIRKSFDSHQKIPATPHQNDFHE
jgi:hypothetical protein